MNEINKCFKCGFDPNIDLLDCFYPTDCTKTFLHIICAEHMGGCGREVWGRNRDETINRWNKNYIDFTSDNMGTNESFLDILNKESLKSSLDKF